MRDLALIFLLLVSQVASTQTNVTAASPRSDQPKLPVIDENACPFEGCTFGEWKVIKDTVLYTSWESNRTVVGKLLKGQKVLGLTGVHVTKKPDVIRVLKAMPELSLRPGDIILRYMYHGEGFADIWANGHWMKDTDCTFVAEKEFGGCLRDCYAAVEEDGVKEWWVKVRTGSGNIGWAKVDKNFDGMDSLAFSYGGRRAYF